MAAPPKLKIPAISVSTNIPSRNRTTGSISEHIQRKLKPIKTNSLRKRSSETLPEIKQRYRFLEVLGSGASCNVFRAKKNKNELQALVDDVASGGEYRDQYAIKSLQKLEISNAELWRREVAILQKIQHPNIVCLIEALEDEKEMHIVLKLCWGGELYDQIADGAEEFSETEIVEFIKTMLLTVHYLHSKNIVHQDLKPSNWVFETEYTDSELVLIDFGTADIINENRIYPPPGIPDAFPYYRSPEYVNQSERSGFVLKQSDMWAIGVMAYVIMTGKPPFGGEDNMEICRNIIKEPLAFPKGLSKCFKDFITKVLDKDPLSRMTISSALDHPWIVSTSVQRSRISMKVSKFLRNFNKTCKFKHILARRLARTMQGEPQELMKRMFDNLDSNGNGCLDVDELAELINYLGWSKTEATKIAPTVMAQADANGDGAITFNEFATIWNSLALSNDDTFVHAVFDALDTNGDGEISLSELTEVLKLEIGEGEAFGNSTFPSAASHELPPPIFSTSPTGELLPPNQHRLVRTPSAQMRDIFQEIDVDGNGKITFDEFAEALEGGSSVYGTGRKRLTRRHSSIQFVRTASDEETDDFLKLLISSPGRFAQENELDLIRVPSDAEHHEI